ncbi:MAG: Fic family protein [Nitrospirae bacterium]|nr:Fic family protein [Nitrospirota bacterium]
MQSKEAQEIFRRANLEYWPWEEFKYKAKHPKFTPEELWGYLKFSRLHSIRKLPFLDAKGNPFGFWLPDKVLEELHYIDQSMGGGFLMEGADLLPEAKERYIISSLMEEAIASSQIEGAATTRRIAKNMLRKNLKPQDRSQQMIVNNYKTILSIKDALEEPMSVQLISRFHKMITENTLDDATTAGRFRKEDEDIQVVDQDGQVLHEPPPAGRLHELVQSLCDFANGKEETFFIHPVIRAIILHFWLAYLHPYVDGNGRIARTLFYWYMLKHKYWLFEYLSISRIFLRSRGQYLRAFLHSELDDCDVTYFIVYHIRAIRLAIKDLQGYLKGKQKGYQATLMLLKKASWMNYRQRALIQHAIKHPDFVYTIESHKNSHNTSYQTARTDLLTLAKKGYLEKIKSGRAFHFIVTSGLPNKVGNQKP